MSALRQSTYMAWQTDPPPFADYLPHLTCIENAVLLADRVGQAPSIGGVWELDPVSVDSISYPRGRAGAVIARTQPYHASSAR